ncbi:MAG: beta-hydroxyacyl-ACP dehydratase, partial [Desulfobacterales bacterium]|nr:beta-hydroxyacyl-ACP dehydratase [Desulfobacterales bacterium]
MLDSQIISLIPHRPPFLWVDKIIETTKDSIVAEKRVPENLEIFKGHYPGHPLLPGVLLCEAIFQTGALLIA